MAQPNKWKYCEKGTNHHPISIKFKECIEDIDSVCVAEGAKKSPFSEEKCVNIDRIEGLLAQREKRNARKTMDIFFGLKYGKQHRILICELRLNYKNVNNLSKSELDSKISNSRNILGNEPLIHCPYLFIFNSNLKNQAYRTLRRLYSNKNIINVMDLNDLKRYYFH